MDRRSFIRNSAAGAFSAAEGVQRAAAVEPRAASTTIGRPVRALSIAFKNGPSVEQVAARVDQEAARGVDLVALPETFRGQNEASLETLDGPSVTAMARLAEKHRAYIVVPIDRKDGDKRFNSAVVLDRRGKIAGVYDKLYPFWVEEFKRTPPVRPGTSATVIETDFGRLGLAICFDANWAPLWQKLSDFGAELVIWPSAYSAGKTLQSRAIDFSYYIMSSTQVPDCLVFDIDGEQLVHEKANSGDFNITNFTFDLDRCIFHQDLNRPGRIGRLLKDHGEDVAEEKWLPMEGLFILKAKKPGVSAKVLAKQYGMEERRPYLNRSRCIVDQSRGWQFS